LIKSEKINHPTVYIIQPGELKDSCACCGKIIYFSLDHPDPVKLLKVACDHRCAEGAGFYKSFQEKIVDPPIITDIKNLIERAQHIEPLIAKAKKICGECNGPAKRGRNSFDHKLSCSKNKTKYENIG
jgi:hypothetical protein